MMKKILIVDDERDVTDFLKMEIEDFCEEFCKNFEVICKNSGYDALHEVMKGDISLLLTDIAMPDMDGYELYSRAKELYEDLPIIMMTGFGYDPNHVVVKSRQDGLKDVIFKPFDIEKLMNKIRSRLHIED
jgi:two-component system, sensor histidine kinase SagS